MCKCTPIVFTYAVLFLVSAHHCFIFWVFLWIIFAIVISIILLIIFLFIIVFLIIIFMVRIASFILIVLWLFLFLQEICFVLSLRLDYLLWMDLASIKSQFLLSMCKVTARIGAFTIHFMPLAEHSLIIRRLVTKNTTILVCAKIVAQFRRGFWSFFCKHANAQMGQLPLGISRSYLAWQRIPFLRLIALTISLAFFSLIEVGRLSEPLHFKIFLTLVVKRPCWHLWLFNIFVFINWINVELRYFVFCLCLIIQVFLAFGHMRGVLSPITLVFLLDFIITRTTNVFIAGVDVLQILLYSTRCHFWFTGSILISIHKLIKCLRISYTLHNT